MVVRKVYLMVALRVVGNLVVLKVVGTASEMVAATVLFSVASTADMMVALKDNGWVDQKDFERVE